MEILIKILDNSSISSMSRDIGPIDLIEILKGLYDVKVTQAVFEETQNSHNPKQIALIQGLHYDVKCKEEFDRLVGSIRQIDRRLGNGEIETIAVSILLSD